MFERSFPRSRIVCVLALCLLVPSLARAQAVIKVNDNVSLRFGTLVQAWADAAEDSAGHTANNLFLRRIRVLFGGQISPQVSFFFETDNPNLGKSPKTLGSGFITQDAWIEWKPRSNAFILDAGLMFIPLCRNCLQSAATHLTLDYGTATFLQSGATQSSVGRDTGFTAKGYLVQQRLEYRIGAFQGIRGTGARNPLRTSGRLQYNFWDTEVVPFFYPGTYLGSKKVLALGGGFDHQMDYDAWAVDFFLERPLPGKNSMTSQINWIHCDGGSTLTTLPEQDDLHAELGYYVASRKLLPFIRFENQNFSSRSGNDQTRYQAGLTWYPNGQNFNIRGAYSRVNPDTGKGTNQLTVQFQFFYY